MIDAFEQSMVDAIVDVWDETLDVIMLWSRNKVWYAQTLRLIHCLWRQPDSATTSAHRITLPHLFYF